MFGFTKLLFNECIEKTNFINLYIYNYYYNSNMQNTKFIMVINFLYTFVFILYITSYNFLKVTCHENPTKRLDKHEEIMKTDKEGAKLQNTLNLTFFNNNNNPILNIRALLGDILKAYPWFTCPRCESTDTRFREFKGKNLNQCLYFCRTCKRSWVEGGVLNKKY